MHKFQDQFSKIAIAMTILLKELEVFDVSVSAWGSFVCLKFAEPVVGKLLEDLMELEKIPGIRMVNFQNLDFTFDCELTDYLSLGVQVIRYLESSNLRISIHPWFQEKFKEYIRQLARTKEEFDVPEILALRTPWTQSFIITPVMSAGLIITLAYFCIELTFLVMNWPSSTVTPSANPTCLKQYQSEPTIH